MKVITFPSFACNLVPRTFTLAWGWGGAGLFPPHPQARGKVLGTRLVRLQKMFFPKEGSLEDRGNIFHGRLHRCIIPFLRNLFCSLGFLDKFSEFFPRGAKDSIIKQNALNAW